MSRGRKLALVVVLAVLAVGVNLGWQIASREVASSEFQSEIRDVASQDGVRIGFTLSESDEEIRNHIIRLARTHDIHLGPAQVTVRSTETGADRALFIAADYDQAIRVLGYTYLLHFSPKSQGRPISQTRER